MSNNALQEDFVDSLSAFFAEYGFKKTGKTFKSELEKLEKDKRWKIQPSKGLKKNLPSLPLLFKKAYDDKLGESPSAKKDLEAGSSEEESSESQSGSDTDSSSGSNESTAVLKAKKQLVKAGSKRKASEVSSSTSDASSSTDSSSGSDSDTSSSSDGPPAATKKQKITETKSKLVQKKTSAKQVGEKGTKKALSSSSSATSDSDSDSSDSSDESSSESVIQKVSTHAVQKLKASTPLRGADSTSTDSSKTINDDGTAVMTKHISRSSSESSDSDSSSSSDSESDSSSGLPSKVRKSKLDKVTVTLETSEQSPVIETLAVSKAEAKKKVIPFSRISKDTVVDPKFSSNAYVPYDYAQKAHEDLIITRGKGFTKEKNKKKRGSYRGGFIDVNGGKGVKFED